MFRAPGMPAAEWEPFTLENLVRRIAEDTSIPLSRGIRNGMTHIKELGDSEAPTTSLSNLACFHVPGTCCQKQAVMCYRERKS